MTEPRKTGRPRGTGRMPEWLRDILDATWNIEAPEPEQQKTLGAEQTRKPIHIEVWETERVDDKDEITN